MLMPTKSIARRVLTTVRAFLLLLASRPQSAYWTGATGKKRKKR